MTERFVVCKACVTETDPRTFDALHALTPIEEREGDWTYYRCPRCREVVYSIADFSELEFGV